AHRRSASSHSGAPRRKTSEPAATPVLRARTTSPTAMLDPRRRSDSLDSLTKNRARVAAEPDHVFDLHAELVGAEERLDCPRAPHRPVVRRVDELLVVRGALAQRVPDVRPRVEEP